jgi:hypothetical protein
MREVIVKLLFAIFLGLAVIFLATADFSVSPARQDDDSYFPIAEMYILSQQGYPGFSNIFP